MAATFSYAQAAKGVAPTPSKTPSESNTPVSKSDEQESEISQTSADIAEPSVEAPADVDSPAANNEKEVSSADSKVEASETSSSTAAAQSSTISREDESSGAPNGTSESTWDKESQTSGTDKQSGTSEGAKGKTAEKEKEKPAPPKELKAAPLPAVNIWQQRKEAQEAKTKATTPSKPVTKIGVPKPTSETSSTTEESQEQPKISSKKKGGDSADKKKGDGAKSREESTPVPPVADAALWPTPQGAQGEEKKKAQEKSEKTDKSPVIRPHGKEKWTPVPYVPTAVFNTPLPSAARRGGRSARGGRDTTRNGGHAGGPSEKSSPGQVSQGPSTKQPTAGDRGRNESNSARANSLPAPSRRSNSTDADARKAPPADRTRGSKGVESANAPAKHVNGETLARHTRPFSKTYEGAHKGGDQTLKNPHLSVDTHNGPRPGPTERRYENGPKSADFSGLHGDRKDFKEKEFSREPRAERGRGGHRGRGGAHAGYNGAQASHYPNNHMAPQNFMHPKSFGGYNDRRGPQQHGLTNGSRGHPMTMRSPSLPNSSSMYNMYPNYPADVNTMYGFQPVQAGPMSAVPYQPYMESWSLMSMITMQLEYYFSVDNLCKDIYLRKHMDSQGFVPLNIIASFKRVKQLTEDYELLRHVSRQLRVAEHYAGEDGIDRLRTRDRWEQWVLPVEQRDVSAQNAGPIPSASQNDAPAPQTHLDAATNGFIPKSLQTNGTYPSKTALSSAAPEFSPSNGVHTGSELSNRDTNDFVCDYSEF
ncbi:hypothetical protein BJY04DRAFT_208620 [Aspergillus karnatakaensis]|uniref:La domain family n=1 Tax=Aspergillus karnatakaensis TaxID=1810916 RepID=UPI003CCDAB06